jgi:hypothetical protein
LCNTFTHFYPLISIKTPFTPIFEKFGQGFPLPRLSSQEYRTAVWRRPCAVSFNLLNASGMCACNDWQFYDPHPLIADVIISSFMTGVNNLCNTFTHFYPQISIKTPFTPIFEKFGQGFPLPRLSSQEYKYIGLYSK